jgi:CheY-like chemotaxis protein
MGSLKMPTVLVVEDEALIRMMVALSLSDDYEVIEATDALEGLACLSRPEPIDLLFSDIVMPGGMDGVQLAEAARKLRPDLKILLTTGYDREALRSRNIDTGIPILNWTLHNSVSCRPQALIQKKSWVAINSRA